MDRTIEAQRREAYVIDVGTRLHYILSNSELLDALIEVIEDLDSDMEEVLLNCLKGIIV